MSNTDITVWERCTLTIEKLSRYFRVGKKMTVYESYLLYSDTGGLCKEKSL